MDVLAHAERIPLSGTDWAIVGGIGLAVVTVVVWLIVRQTRKTSN